MVIHIKHISLERAIHIPEATDRKSKYTELIPEIRSLLKDEPDLIANMAIISAVLKEALNFLWVGFYIVKEDHLVLGPFQGPLPCTRIAKDKGVCGSSWARKEAVIVPDVNKFPGHIACSAASNSEIVIPAIKNHEVLFVLDIDSIEVNDFTVIDREYLQIIIDDTLNYSVT